MIKMSRKAKKAMAVALTAGMLASTAATPVMAATQGWKQNSKGWWYENADGSYPANKWAKINGVWYYFDANGYMLSNSWVKDKAGDWYYVGANGAMKVNSWVKDSKGNWYWLTDDGSMFEGGWARINGKWYFFNNDGVMQTGILNVEDKVYYLTSNGDMVVGEYKINDVTYTFDASGAATGETVPTATKAFKKDGTPVAIKEEERALSVTAVTAITKNADEDFVLTALINEVVGTEELKDTTLTLTNGDIVLTAEFVSVNDATAVYKIKNAATLTPGDSSSDGAYVVTGNGIDVATELTANYEETLIGNSVQGFVYYIDPVFGPTGIKNAEVKVGKKTVNTDANGYYSIAASSGVVTVDASATGFFGQIASTNVSRNYPSTQNVELAVYDQEKLYINGTILDKADSKPVEGVKVELQKKNADGKFTTIATANTTTTGEFGFGNSDSVIVDADDNNPDADGYVKFAVDNGNKLSKDATYQVVVSKDYKTNLYDAYHAETITVSLSTTGAQTNLKNIFMTAVKEINSAKVTLTWANDATIMDSTAATTYSLMDQNGVDVLASGDIVNGDIDADTKTMKNGAELVDALTATIGGETGKYTLPTGTYYLVVNDGVNAYCVITLNVEEGKDLTVAGTVKKATKVSVNTVVETIVYEEVADKYDDGNVYVIDATAVDGSIAKTATPVNVTYGFFQVVNGVNVYVGSATGADFTLVNNTASANTDFTRLMSGESYVCVPNQDYINAGSVTVSNSNASSIVTKTNEVQSAANIETIDLTTATWVDSDNQTVDAPSTAKVTIKIVDAKSGKVVRETSKSDVNFTATVDTTLWDGAYNPLKGIPAGEYKAIIEVAGYSAVTTDAFKLYDFQKATLTTDKTFKKDAITTITGYLRFADDNAVVADADAEADAVVLLYDANGVVVASDVIGISDAEATYKIVNGDNTGTDAWLTSGTYKLVVRGEGFETYVKQVVLKDKETVTYNIDVTRHIGGQAKLAIRDTNNYGFGSSSAVSSAMPTLLDANYVAPGALILDKHEVIETLDGTVDASFLGEYVTDGSSVEYETEDNLSKGTYTILVPETEKAWGLETTITVATVNGTSYKDIVTTAKTTGKTIPLTIKYDATYLVDAADKTVNSADWIVVEDENGNVLFTVANNVNGVVGSPLESVVVNVNADATYVVKVYSEGKFIGSEKVTVQGFAKSVTVALDDATRN